MSGTAGNVVQATHIGTVTFAAASAPTVVPHQVPPPPHGFVDRSEILERLTALAGQADSDGGRPVVVAVHGMPGVGKTALLRTSAARIGERFPDGILHAEFGPLRGQGGAAVSEVAAGMLRALGVADQWVPTEFAGRVDLLRSMTAGSQLLVVLDDVGHEAQVTALLPNSPRSMVLVAGNRTLEGLLLDGAVDIELRALELDHAVELLTGMCPDGRIATEPAATRSLVELCDRLPLALRVVGARLATRPRWPVSRLVHELSDLSGTLDGLVTGGTQVVRAVFDLVYDDMPEGTARVYRILGLLVGPHFGAEVVAAMAELPLRTVRQMLDELAQLNMLDERPDGGFQLHRLVRLHALGRSQQDETAEQRVGTLRRALRWWLLGAVAADVAVTGWERLRITEPRALLGDVVVDIPRSAALDWLEREHPNLLGLMRAATDNGWYDEVWQMFEALYAFYDNRQPLVAWVEAGELAVAAAHQAGNVAAEARARCQLARALQKREQFVMAHQHLDLARTLARAVDERLFASTLDFTGNVHFSEGQYDTALDYFRQALVINERLGRTRGAALMCYLAGRALTELGRVNEALDMLARARELLKSTDGTSLLPRVLLSTGATLLDGGRAEDARAVIAEARELAREDGITATEADALLLLARMARYDGDPVGEQHYLREAEMVLRTMGSPRAARIYAHMPQS
jgi:tetratricopeptide (TPR) repeat protein